MREESRRNRWTRLSGGSTVCSARRNNCYKCIAHWAAKHVDNRLNLFHGSEPARRPGWNHFRALLPRGSVSPAKESFNAISTLLPGQPDDDEEVAFLFRSPGWKHGLGHSVSRFA